MPDPLLPSPGVVLFQKIARSDGLLISLYEQNNPGEALDPETDDIFFQCICESILKMEDPLFHFTFVNAQTRRRNFEKPADAVKKLSYGCAERHT